MWNSNTKNTYDRNFHEIIKPIERKFEKRTFIYSHIIMRVRIYQLLKTYFTQFEIA